jgi:inner membrane protein
MNEVQQTLMSRLLPAFKIGTILFLTLLLLWPVAQIRNSIWERQSLRDNVVQDIARSTAYAQTITGPLVVVPYTREVQVQREDENHTLSTVTRDITGELRLLPTVLEVDGNLGTEERRRGIYRARVFNANTLLKASFDIPANFGVVADLPSYQFGAPILVLGISDIRGIGNALTLRANTQSTPFQPGTGSTLLVAGVHAPLTVANASELQQLNFEVELKLQGTGAFNIRPVGRETHVKLTSDWPHPSFVGEFLPTKRETNADGFSAEWQTSFFATNMQEVIARCVGDAEHLAANCQEFNGRSFGVSFVDPVDQYLKSERAAKYAFLFIGLTFAGFFLFEVLRRYSVHPVQYGLVGVALAMFFLLLLSFSEHIGFAAAYAVSATACVGLITFYISHALTSRTVGFTFGTALAGLYGLLYGILSSEDYALLMGSLLVFGLLTAVMVLTRRVNWSALGAGTRAAPIDQHQ